MIKLINGNQVSSSKLFQAFLDFWFSDQFCNLQSGQEIELYLWRILTLKKFWSCKKSDFGSSESFLQISLILILPYTPWILTSRAQLSSHATYYGLILKIWKNCISKRCVKQLYKYLNYNSFENKSTYTMSFKHWPSWNNPFVVITKVADIF